MIQIDNKWQAQDGYMFIRKSDNQIMGNLLFLAEDDSIANYMERPFSSKEIEDFEKEYSFAQEAGIGSPSDDEGM